MTGWDGGGNEKADHEDAHGQQSHVHCSKSNEKKQSARLRSHCVSGLSIDLRFLCLCPSEMFFFVFAFFHLPHKKRTFGFSGLHINASPKMKAEEKKIPRKRYQTTT
jgi:hypothetical protein